MGKVEVGGGKPFHPAPSPKHEVAAPSPKPVPRSWSSPKPSVASVYQHSAPHRVVSHNAGYGPRPTPRGSGVHAAVRAQPVRSQGHSAAVARLASKLAQQTSARAATKASTLARLVSGAGNSDLLWENPLTVGKAVGRTAWDTNDLVYHLRHELGLTAPIPPLDLGPQGGFLERGFPGYDRLPRPPGMGHKGAITQQMPIPRFPVARTPRARSQQQRALGFRAPNSQVPQGPRPYGMRGSGRGPNYA